MKIVDAAEVPVSNRNKKTLNAVEEWLFSKEGRKVRLVTLMNLEESKAAVVEKEEISKDNKNVRWMDNRLNAVFIIGEIPLLARRLDDNHIVIRKLQSFNIGEYGKVDSKPLSNSHQELLKSKLAEVMA